MNHPIELQAETEKEGGWGGSTGRGRKTGGKKREGDQEPCVQVAWRG